RKMRLAIVLLALLVSICSSIYIKDLNNCVFSSHTSAAENKMKYTLEALKYGLTAEQLFKGCEPLLSVVYQSEDDMDEFDEMTDKPALKNTTTTHEFLDLLVKEVPEMRGMINDRVMKLENTIRNMSAETQAFAVKMRHSLLTAVLVLSNWAKEIRTSAAYDSAAAFYKNLFEEYDRLSEKSRAEIEKAICLRAMLLPTNDGNRIEKNHYLSKILLARGFF
ncbi:hypothetical protein PFISCL1PPCAC_9046, partial [Pristionchus fissidentatus]